MHELAASELLAREYLYLFQRTVLIEWARCVEEQVVVDNGVHAAVLQHYLDVLVQFFAYHERMVQLCHQHHFLWRQLVG